jgi:hypothetical protein
VDRKDLFRLAEDPRFIPGIYNYCDRWCERCPFTARCLLYATEEEAPLDPEARDLHNAAFWDQMQEIFAQTRQMLEELAAEQGIDLTAIAVEDAVKERRRRRARVKKEHLPQQAMKYVEQVNAWFRAEQGRFEQKQEELQTAANLALPGHDPAADATAIADAVAVIRWYQHFIYVKLHRALCGEANEDILDDEGKPFPRDADGSAKIALIALDRSLAAWAQLRAHFPDRADSILDLLVHLERLRRQAEARFPRARSFQRPGFDDDPEPASP